MPELISLSAAASRLGVRAKVLSDLIWLQQIDVARCPLIGRTRAIPVNYLPTIRSILVSKGKLPAREVAQ
jgi:hypothetical protein